MKYNSVIPKTRVETDLLNKIQDNIKNMNENSDINISLSSYTRMALKFFTEKIKADKEFNIHLKFKS